MSVFVNTFFGLCKEAMGKQNRGDMLQPGTDRGRMNDCNVMGMIFKIFSDFTDHPEGIKKRDKTHFQRTNFKGAKRFRLSGSPLENRNLMTTGCHLPAEIIHIPPDAPAY